jgi:tRNA (guanine37-N1)-methyltransferase
MKVEILTIFPKLFDSLFEFGMIKQAVNKGLLRFEVIDLRDFSSDKHKSVDDRPYGGGQGMVLKPEPVFRAVDECRSRDETSAHIVLLTPQGFRFDQAKAKELSLKTRLIFVCGRYEGVDQRVADHLADEELSVGDFVLSGGEFAAAVMIDAVSRLIPGVLGQGESVLDESFMEGLLDYPQYTRPEEYRGHKVPEVLLSGNHAEIRRWRDQEVWTRTRTRRPDLLESAEDRTKE